ncbi:MAG: PH domain-containing protein [Candidatus Cloacimonetes bacterium]|nr:PH domain-containing protein [Candidatus Cloacimonadota bacterium]
MNIKPDKKLLTKSWLILLTISIFLIIFTFILQIIPMLDDDVEMKDFSRITWIITIGLLILMWIISVPITILWIRNLTYIIGEDKIIIHKGILTKIQQNIPFRMVTDFKLERSLYDRWFGIGSIKIQTAGQTQNASGYEGKLSGLIDCNSIHEQLRNKLSLLFPSSKTGKFTEDSGLSNKNELTLILEELRNIRSVLEKKK